MRPTVLANFGLVTALRTLADEAAQRNNWMLDLQLPADDIQLDEQTEIALFRVAQESLTNAAKYARASRVSIGLQVDDDRLRCRSPITASASRRPISSAHIRTACSACASGWRRTAGASTSGGACRAGTEIHVVMPCARSAAPMDDAAPDIPSQRRPCRTAPTRTTEHTYTKIASALTASRRLVF